MHQHETFTCPGEQVSTNFMPCLMHI